VVYKWYILPIGGLYITYHLLREPETAIEKIHDKNSLPSSAQVAVVQSSPVGISTWTLWDFSHSKRRIFFGLFVWGGLKMGRNNVSGQFFFGDLKMLNFPIDL